MSILLQEYANVKRSQKTRGFGSNNFYKNMTMITEAFLDIEKTKRNMLIYEFTLLEDRRRGIITEEEAAGGDISMWQKFLNFLKSIWARIKGLFAKSGNQAVEAVQDGVSKFENEATSAASRYRIAKEQTRYPIKRIIPSDLADEATLKNPGQSDLMQTLRKKMEEANIVTRSVGDFLNYIKGVNFKQVDTTKMGEVRSKLLNLQNDLTSLHQDSRNDKFKNNNDDQDNDDKADAKRNISNSALEINGTQVADSGMGRKNSGNRHFGGSAGGGEALLWSYVDIKSRVIEQILPLVKNIPSIEGVINQVDEVIGGVINTFHGLGARANVSTTTKTTPPSAKYTKSAIEIGGSHVGNVHHAEFTTGGTSTSTGSAMGVASGDKELKSVDANQANAKMGELRGLMQTLVQALQNYASHDLHYLIQDMYEIGNNLGKVKAVVDNNQIGDATKVRNSEIEDIGDAHNVNASYYDYNRYGFYGN